jgi:hypothetical protein
VSVCVSVSLCLCVSVSLCLAHEPRIAMARVFACIPYLLLTGCVLNGVFAPIHARAERQGGNAAMARTYAAAAARPYYDTIIGKGVRGKYTSKHNKTEIEDFKLPKLMKAPLTIWTYNCQRMSSTHKKDWDLMLGKKRHMAYARHTGNVHAKQG